MKPTRIAVLGGGSWGTAIVRTILTNLDQIGWFIRDQEQIDYLQHHGRNPKYLSSLPLPVNRITFYHDLNRVLSDHEVLFLAIPTSAIKITFKTAIGQLQDKYLASGVKGLIPGEMSTPAAYFSQTFGMPPDHYAVFSGPCHAEEVAMEKLAYLTVASANPQLSEWVCSWLETWHLKTQTSVDVLGIEYATALKNTMAIAAGIAHGLNYGDNMLAVLVANGMQEMKRFMEAQLPGKREILGSAYLGDLLVTSYSQFSRNRTFGAMIGKGYSVKAALLEMNMAVEGLQAVKGFYMMNKPLQVPMPIMDAIYHILFENTSPAIEYNILTNHLH